MTMTSLSNWQRHLSSLLMIWIAPMVIGAITAAYKIFLYRTVHFIPELEPSYVVWPALIGGMVGALVLCSVLKKWYLPIAAKRPVGKLLMYAGLALILAYVWFRAQVVEIRLISRFGYCCCCMEQATDAETMHAVLSPIAY
ncbi:hypothetical protein RF679_00335 [Undibacterium cyanobacteriorum]|uniref:Vitamin K epoxide reductase domain-containing protein n=1 Tax=Undibacterium cyanobacteriorum TaxID=3073561 RepID=A0ABY9RL36_9BURK|nr:hypothetical protein [Undibacterium sp. 20NA77.5]WMW80741.1 hypothetical protein RF679_00335 [Undibacterium sp. 20NA77.5]